MDKEQKWLQKRLGMITASELGQITSASGKIIDGNLSYIRQKRYERLHGFALPVSSRAMEIGNEQEPMINEWIKSNYSGNIEDIVYSKDLPEIPFWTADFCRFGASPDAYVDADGVINHVLEYKTVVGNTEQEFFGDEFTSYEEKKAHVWKDHGDQILGQFLSKDSIEVVSVIKYIPQWDDIISDTDSPLAKWRGISFHFYRKDYEASIDEMRERIILFDKMIDAPINPSEFKKGEWYVDDNGQLLKK